MGGFGCHSLFLKPCEDWFWFHSKMIAGICHIQLSLQYRWVGVKSKWASQEIGGVPTHPRIEISSSSFRFHTHFQRARESFSGADRDWFDVVSLRSVISCTHTRDDEWWCYGGGIWSVWDLDMLLSWWGLLLDSWGVWFFFILFCYVLLRFGEVPSEREKEEMGVLLERGIAPCQLEVQH